MARALTRKSLLAPEYDIPASARRGFAGLIDFATCLVEIAVAAAHIAYRATAHITSVPELGRRSRQARSGHYPSVRPSARAASEESIESLTRAQLYERAQRLEIPGRSQMNKAELLQALSSASPKASAPAEATS